MVERRQLGFIISGFYTISSHLILYCRRAFVTILIRPQHQVAACYIFTDPLCASNSSASIAFPAALPTPHFFVPIFGGGGKYIPAFGCISSSTFAAAFSNPGLIGLRGPSSGLFSA